MMLAANPLNRAHERMIREAISNSDLLVIFLRKPFTSEGLRYDIRHNALSTFVDNFLPRNKVLIIPFENTYIFTRNIKSKNKNVHIFTSPNTKIFVRYYRQRDTSGVDFRL